MSINEGSFSFVPGAAAKKERKVPDAPLLPGRKFFPLKFAGQGLGKLLHGQLLPFRLPLFGAHIPFRHSQFVGQHSACRVIVFLQDGFVAIWIYCLFSCKRTCSFRTRESVSWASALQAGTAKLTGTSIRHIRFMQAEINACCKTNCVPSCHARPWPRHARPRPRASPTWWSRHRHVLAP